jgi:hypothetical protein
MVQTTKNPYTKRGDSDTTTRAGDSGRTITPQSTSRGKTKSRDSHIVPNSSRKRSRRSSAPPRNQLRTSLGPSSTQQFPHRAGRVRSSHFGASLRMSSLSISRSGENDSNARGGASSALQDSESDGDENFSSALENKKAGPILNSDKPEQDPHTSPIRHNPPAMDTDDDDEVALFSYVAFPKAK